MMCASDTNLDFMVPSFPSIDVDVAHPDEKSIITYVSSLYDAMPRIPEAQEGHVSSQCSPFLRGDRR